MYDFPNQGLFKASPDEKAFIGALRMTRVKQETRKRFKSKCFVLLPKGMDTVLI